MPAPEAASSGVSELLFFNHSSQLSGGEIALLNSLRAGLAAKATVVVERPGPLTDALDSVNGARWTSRTARACSLRSDPLGRSVARRRPFAILSTLMAMRRFYNAELAANRAQVVVFNTARSALIGAMLRRRGRFFVYHVRDRLAGDYFGGMRATVARAVASRYDALICNSLATLITTPVRPVRKAVIPSPVADDFFAPRVENISGDAVEILMVGRISPWKGQLEFVNALAIVKARSAHPWRARIVGGALFGEDDYERRVAEAIERLDLSDRVELVGHRQDVARLMLTSDLVVHASVVPEPFGQVVVQAMAAGCAVVAANRGGPAEVIQDGVDGVLVDPVDAEALARAVQVLVESSETRLRLSRSATARAQVFRVQSVVGEMARFLYDPEASRGSAS